MSLPTATDARRKGTPPQTDTKSVSHCDEKPTIIDRLPFAVPTTRLIAGLIVLCLVFGSLTNSWLASGDGISRSTYDDLVRYTKYSSGAYHPVCLKPLGNHLVQSVSDQHSYWA